jgi:hypothetical protein
MRDIHTERSDNKFNITLNIHIYELIKQTLVDTHRKLTKCRKSDSTTNHLDFSSTKNVFLVASQVICLQNDL